MLSEQAEKREVAFPVLTPLWDDPFTAALAAAGGTPPKKECFSGDCIVFVTGRENDGTGLYYYRARYYSPKMQRFISEDPIGFGGGDVNFYAYVGNNPVNWVDPSGTITWGGALGLGFDAGGLILDTSGTYGYYGGAALGAIGATAGLVGGLPGAFVGGVVGGFVGNVIGGFFDDKCAGQLNCGEKLPPPAPPSPPKPPSPPSPPGPPGPPPCGRKC